MNSKSPVNMFGASSSTRVRTGVTFYNSRKVTSAATMGGVRRKTDTEPISIPSPRQGSPYNGGSPRGGSPRGGSPSGGAYYAGAKFSEPPSPASLPNPPSHWMAGDCSQQFMMGQQVGGDQYREISNQLKLLLNIRA